MIESKERLYLLDILKIMTLLAIAILHANEFVFYTDVFPLGNKTPVWHGMSYYARVFTLGGQILVSLIYFLFGFSSKSRKSLLLISLFALLGQTILALVFEAPEWDIYAYIAVSNLLIAGIPFFFSQNKVVLIISLLMLWIPTSFFQAFSEQNPIWIILTGLKSNFNSGSWPLLPWFFLSLFNYQLGLITREKRVKLKEMNRREITGWIICLILSLPFLGAYYWVPIGPNYYHFVFNQSPWIYWSNILIFLFVMRISLLDSVQVRLKNSPVVLWISQLYWIRHLGLVYLLSIIYLGIGMRFSGHFQQFPLVFDLFFIGILPINELLGRFLIKAVKYLR